MRAAICVLLLATAAHAQDDFEIQVYDAETAGRQQAGFELHLNTGGDAFTHFTLEPHVGLLGWLEAGAYFQRSSAPTPPSNMPAPSCASRRACRRRHRGFGFALNGEVASEPSGMGGELRPIVDFTWKRLYVSVNPIVSFSGEGVDFEPAAKLTINIIPALSAGVEWYGTALAGVERIFGVIDVAYGRLGLNLGAGYSFGPARSDNKWIVKSIVSLEL